jgi:predicted DNA-binding transcriptional regulator YafY
MNRTGVTFKEIQEMFDVSLRTAQRYAKVLREASEANMPTIAVAAQVRGEYGLALNPAWRYYQN